MTYNSNRISITNDAEYEAAMARLSELMTLNPEVGTVEDGEISSLVRVIAKYEVTVIESMTYKSL